MQIQQIVPVLRVKDARASERFYTAVLGFTKSWEHQFTPDSPLLISMTHSGVFLFLTEHTGAGTDDCDIYLNVHDVDAFHAAYSAHGLLFEKSPTTESWGMREITFRDLDNHRFTLGSPATA